MKKSTIATIVVVVLLVVLGVLLIIKSFTSDNIGVIFICIHLGPACLALALIAPIIIGED